MIVTTPNERCAYKIIFDTGSGGYWVRRMRSNRIKTFFFSRDYYHFERKIAKLEIKSK